MTLPAMTTRPGALELNPRLWGGLALGLLFLGAGLAVLISVHRSYQVDEVEHVHVAWSITQGSLIYRDFWEGHNPLLYLSLSPWVALASDPTSIFRVSRVFSLIFGLFANVVVVALCSKRAAGGGLGVGRWAALSAAGLLLLHTTFVERAMEVRPDGFLALATTTALLLELSTLESRHRFPLEALALSAAFLFSQKAVFFCVLFGCIWLLEGIARRSARIVILPVIAWSIPVVAMLIVFALLGNLEEYLRYNVFDAGGTAIQAVGATAVARGFRPWGFLWHEGARNLGFSFLALLSLAWLLIGVVRGRAGRGETVVLLFAMTGSVSICLNPFPFPYLHVTALPGLSIACGLFISRVADARAPMAVVLALAIQGASSLPRLIAKAVTDELQDHQMQTLRTTQELTSPDDHVWDMVGLYFRPDAYPVFVMTNDMLQGYTTRGRHPRMIPKFRERELVLTMINYRTAWLPEDEKRFIDEHFVHYDGNVFVLGTSVKLAPGGLQTFDVLKEKEFAFAGEGVLSVDGTPFSRGRLPKGPHTLESQAGATGRLLLSAGSPLPAAPVPPRDLYTNWD